MYCEAMLGEQRIVGVVLGTTPDEAAFIVRFFGIEHKIPIDDVSAIADTVSELVMGQNKTEAEKFEAIKDWLYERRKVANGFAATAPKKHVNRYASSPEGTRVSPKAPTPSRASQPAATLPPPPPIPSNVPCGTMQYSHGFFVIFFEPNEQIPARYKSWERVGVTLAESLKTGVLYRRSSGQLVEASTVQR